MSTRWSLTRGLSYFFGNRETCEELTRLREECASLTERLLQQHRVRPVVPVESAVTIESPAPVETPESWQARREAEIVEQKALDAVRDPVLLEQFAYFAEVDPELYNPVLLKAEQIKAEITAGTYREPQER